MKQKENILDDFKSDIFIYISSCFFICLFHVEQGRKREKRPPTTSDCCNGSRENEDSRSLNFEG